MNVFEGSLQAIHKKIFAVLSEGTATAELDEFFKRVQAEVDNFKRTGSFNINENANIKKERITNVLPDVEGSKENVPDHNNKNQPPPRMTRNNALVEIQSTLSVTKSPNVKLERISEINSATDPVMEMPPPKLPVRKVKTRRNTKMKQDHVLVKEERESDVIIQPAHVSIVCLTDSDDEAVESQPKRSTRTKTRAAEKNLDSASEDNGEKDSDKSSSKKETKSKEYNYEANTNQKPVRSTRTKTRAQKKPVDEPSSEETATPEEVNKHENAINGTITINKPADSTVILEKPTLANETVIIPRDQRVVVTTPLNKQVNISELMTDDEDEETYNKTKSKKLTKPLFNTFEQSPVKKRVEAFEKLGGQLKGTETKTKLRKTKEDEYKTRYDISMKPTIKPKSKISVATPTKSNTRLLPISQTTLKHGKSTQKEVMLGPKSASALKAYQQEFIEREQRRKEKELEAARKKEALLQAKREESKRKREEKQLKAQQAREALLKAKLEAAEEAERVQKRVLEKKPEEEMRAETPNQMKYTSSVKIVQKPIYLQKDAPSLPLDDCYDSDDERRVERPYRPNWTRSIKPALGCISYAGLELTNTFFMCTAMTLNLEALFGKMNPKKLKRTSSAIWHKPPRFTIMPIPTEIDEEDDSS